jgi:hypothetical protein
VHVRRCFGNAMRRSPGVPRRLCAAVLLVGALTAQGSAASAGGGTVVGGSGIEARVPGFQLHTGGHRGASPCTWYSADEVFSNPDLLSQFPPNLDPRTMGTGTIFNAVPDLTIPGLLDIKPYFRTCNGSIASGDWLALSIWAANLGPIAALIPGDLVNRYLKPPVLAFHPLDPEFGWAYVHVPLDVGTTPAQWRSYTVTAENDAPPAQYRWVTVTATPKEFTFKPGGGADEVTCRGDGPIAAFDPANPGPCSVVFKHESSTAANGRSFAVRGEITWKVTYESSGGPGALPDITLGTDGNIAVAAMKALVTCTGAETNRSRC